MISLKMLACPRSQFLMVISTEASVEFCWVGFLNTALKQKIK